MRARLSKRCHKVRHEASVLMALVFGLRALIPTGYMVAQVDGHAHLLMCPAGIHLSAGMAGMAGMRAIAGMDHAAGLKSSGHGVLAGGQCPFALAGGASLLARAPELSQAYFSVLGPLRALAIDSVCAAPPFRHQAPRGPPSLA